MCRRHLNLLLHKVTTVNVVKKAAGSEPASVKNDGNVLVNFVIKRAHFPVETLQIKLLKLLDCNCRVLLDDCYTCAECHGARVLKRPQGTWALQYCE